MPSRFSGPASKGTRRGRKRGRQVESWERGNASFSAKTTGPPEGAGNHHSLRLSLGLYPHIVRMTSQISQVALGSAIPVWAVLSRALVDALAREGRLEVDRELGIG